MSNYLSTQVAVYRHLLTRHTAEPDFRFSLRQKFSKESSPSQGLFIGTNKSLNNQYFAFTLWYIPIGFPGSAMDLLDYIVRVNPDGTFGLRVELLLAKERPADPQAQFHENTLPSVGLFDALQVVQWPQRVHWVAAPLTNRMLQLTYTVARNIPTLEDLLTTLNDTLDATMPGIDEAVAAHAARTPTWVGGHRLTQVQFDKMRQRAELRCADMLAGKYPNPAPHPRAYWCVQVEMRSGATGVWNRYQSQGVVRPLFGQLLAGTAGPSDSVRRQLDEARPGDVVVVVRGPRQVLGVGLLTGRFDYDDHDNLPFYCPAEWVLTHPVELADTPFLTGNNPWTRTAKWPEIQAAYARLPAQRAALAQLVGPEVTDEDPDDELLEEPEAADESPTTAGPPAYWWLNINADYWKVADFEVGQEQTWTTHNEKGNKRNVYAHFQQVKPGDLVIGYETTPTKRIKAILEITEGVHSNEEETEPEAGTENSKPDPKNDIISLRVKEFVREELTLHQLKQMPELTQSEPLTFKMGSLYKLTPNEFDAIFKRALRIEAPPLPPYTLAEAEQDLFLATADIQHLQAALKRKKNLIVQGPPGVGKTYVARRLAWLQMQEQDDNRVQLVQFHQSYSYEDFIRGWRPTATGGFELANGVFIDFVRKAQHDQAHDYFFIIDEINRGNLSKIFGELLMLLEADKRSAQYALPLTYRKEGEAPFYLPPNLYVIGTMNTADRSLALVDYALRRRFTFVDLIPMLGDKLVQHLVELQVPASLATKVVKQVEDLNKTIHDDKNLGAGFLIGHSYFCTPLGGQTPEAWWSAIVQHDIAPLLREYWFDAETRAAKAILALEQGAVVE
ncbi:AAA family ATPase [Hymenobacter wooponensis]|uniref:EVE domain-containing protein n=1 Tax=Hymenobacter wooponensis TaxID=1525360 RepID=A0A4Z0MNN9_9BACT|nr:AAA family ATPase [Hymenobacter wooponensis]TGD80815.1 EVE domain-containing protein [Hymenobacter wooponensis]